MKFKVIQALSFAITIFLFFCGTSAAFAQLTGVKTIPGNYATVTAAVNAVNASGVGAGGVTFNVAANYTETIAVTISLTATGTAANPIVFQKDPGTSGANPLITSYTGGVATPASNVQDGIWKLIGSDYVTINAIDLKENAANTTNPSTMEYGFALYKASTSNGCQFVTIKNCVIALNTINNAAGALVDGSTGILVVNALATAGATALTPVAGGTNSNNKFYSNTIQNCNTGIALIGYAAASPFTLADNNNDVGGSTVANGNTIINFGGAAGAVTAANAVRTLAQYGLNVSYNTINNNNGTGTNHPYTLRGILVGAAASANETITFNTITLKGGGTTQAVEGIENNAGSTPASNVVNLDNNTITNGTYATATTGGFYGIYNLGAPATLTVGNNAITNNSSAATTTGFFYGILNTGVATSATINANTFTGNSTSALTTGIFAGIYNTAAVPTLTVSSNTLAGNTTTSVTGQYIPIYNTAVVTTAININSNNIGTGLLPAITFSAANSTAQTFINNTKGGAAAALSISNNNFYNVTFTAGGTSAITFISNAGATLSQAINSNIFTNLNVNTTGSITFISNSVVVAATGTQNVNSNSISGTFTKATGGTITLFTSGASSASGSVINNNNNNFSNITVTGATIIAGWVNTDAGSSTKTIQNNTFSNWTGATGAITALSVNLTGTSNATTGNLMNNISSAGAITGIATGAGNDNIYSNTINTLSTTGAAAIMGISVTSGITKNVYKNKIYDLQATNVAGTVYGIAVSGAATAVTTANIYNNLIGDLRAPAASAVDPIRGISITSTKTFSNINVYYNTIYLNATSTGANFGTTGIYHTASATSTTAALNLTNNIVSNTSTPTGTGLTVAYRISTTSLSNYATASNYNLYYAGLPSASRLLFYNGTNSDQLLSTYKTRVSTRETFAVTEDLITTSKFLSTSGSSASFLHLDPTQATQAESGGIAIEGITDDYDSQPRQGAAGYTGTGLQPDIGASEFEGIPLKLAGTYNVGTGQVYTSLTKAGGLFAAINSVGVSGNITVNITSNLAEDGTNALNQWTEHGGSNYTLTIQPSASVVRTISGNVVAGLIRFNGANRVTIDGSNGTTNNYLTFSNTNTAGTTGTAFTFINGASNNTIKYCNIEAFANATNGVVLFSTTTAAAGNSNNQVSNCSINGTVAGNNSNVNVYSAGTVGKENTANSLLNNNIYNFRDRAVDIAATGSTGWTISGNSMYNGDLAAVVSYATGSTLHGIRILGGSGYNILNNYFGGNAALAAGTIAAYTSTGILSLQGILLTTTSALPVSNIKGNTLAKISVSVAPVAVGAANVFIGIETNGSGINIGGSVAGEGNTIGSNTTNGSIAITTSTPLATYLTNIRGINCNSSGGAILGNQVGGIDIQNIGAAPGPSTFLGIYVNNAASPSTINNNIIGSNGTGAAANSIRVLATSTSTTTSLTGILIGAAPTSAIQVDGNIIQNVSFLSTTTATISAGGLVGISNTAVAPISITNNIFAANNIASYTTGLFYGITNSAANTTLNINNNTITGNLTASATGVYYPIYNSGAVTGTININNNNIGNSSTNSFTFNTNANSGSQILIYNKSGAGTAALSISNNNFQGINYAVAGTGSYTFINNSAATLSQAINSNTFTNLNVNTSGNITFISNSVAVPATGTQNVNNNSIVTAFTKGAGGTVTLFSSAATSVAGSVINNNTNNFSNITVTGATTVAGWVNTDAGSFTKTIQNNVFANWTGGTAAITALNVNLTAATNAVTGNLINTISAAAAVTGITSAVGNNNIYGNTINTLSSTAAAAVTAISITGGTTDNIYKNKIYDLSNSNAGGSVNGLLISGGTTVNIYNNIIGDLRTPVANSATDAIRGINITSATVNSAINVYFNTIYVNATSSGATFSSTGVYHAASATATTAALNLRNNIITNTSTPNGAGKTVAYRRSTNVFTNYVSTSNNNLLYAGVPSAARLLYYDGVNSDQNFTTYKPRVAPRDAASVTEDLSTKYLSTTGSSAVFLHMNTTIASQIESGAANIAGYTDDFDGQIRAGNPGYTGVSSSPDIGADEIFGLETVPPVISYTALTNTTTTVNRSLTGVVITDGSGVNTAAGSKPRIYYKRFSDANVFLDNTSATNGWKYAETIGSASPFDFTIDYSLLYKGAAVTAGVVQYFVVAQDIATVANVGINSGTFNSTPAGVALTSSAFPVTGAINSYNIAFSGSYNVGTGEVFTSLTKADGLFASINNSGFSGNVTVNVTSVLTEDGTNALNAWTEFGAGNYTLGIQPNAGVLRTISGDAIGGLIRFNGASRVTIDGSYAGSGSYFSFKNTNATGTTGTAFTFLEGASNNILKNLDAQAYANATNGVILFSTSTVAGGNSNNLVDNSTINATVAGNTGNTGVYSAGTAGKENAGNTISNSKIYNYRDRGIDIASGSSAWSISANDLYNGAVTGSVNYPASSALYGIRISGGSGYSVLNNHVGGRLAGASGANAAYSSTLGDLFYAGISLTTTSALPASNIKGNTIAATTVSSVPTAAVSGVFSGIETFGLGVNIGGTAAEGNIIGSNTVNGSVIINTATTSIANTSAIYGINNGSSGGVVNYNHVGGIDISNTGTAPAASTIQGISVSNAAAPTQVNNNLIGSNAIANSIRVLSTSTAVAPVINGISIGISVNTTLQVNSNNILNISNLSTTSSGSFTGINNNAAAGAIVTISQDTIQNINTAANANAGSTAYTGIYSGATSTISNNAISAISLLSSGVNAQVVGINASGAFVHTISGNSITILTTSSNKISASVETGTPAGSAIVGILNSATVAGQVISSNVVSNFTAGSTAASNTVVTGIGISASVSGNLYNNRISRLKNTATGTSPGIAGIMAAGGSFSAYNNTVKINNSTNTNGVNIYGINHAAGANWNYYFNTVEISGSASGTALRSAAFIRPVAGGLSLKDNVFVNIRTGTGTNYAISNPVAPPVTSWPSTTADYNNLYSANKTTTGEWGAGTNTTFAQWQTSSGGDSHSASASVSFIASTIDLQPDSSTNCSLNKGGIPITSPVNITTDINGVARSTPNPDLGAYEFNYNIFTIAASSDSPTCLGNTVGLTVDPGTALSPTYSWKNPSGVVVATTQNPNVAAAAGNFTVTVTDLNGCSVTASTLVTLTTRPSASLTSSSASICEGSPVNVVLTVTGTGTFNGTLSDGTSFTGTAPTITVPVTPSVTTAFYIADLSDDNCTSIRSDIPDTVKIAVTHTGDWLGGVSTNWNDANNWCGGIPTTATSINITSGHANYPVLSSGTGAVNDINIDAGASLTITGASLQVSGDITSSGTITADNGSIEFNGASPQIIPAATFAANALKNLTINNSTGVALNGALNLTGVLLAANGALNANGNLTLISSATQTALIDGSGAGSVTGNLTMQRYLAAGFGYKYFSSPFQAATVAAFSSTVDLAAAFPNFYTYVENIASSGFASYTTSTNVLTPLKGYAVDFGATTAAKTVSITGVVNNGSISSNIFNNNKTYTLGFNLVGNPYPSPVDWDSATGWTRTNIDNAIYYFDSGSTSQYTGTYSTYINGVSSDGVANNIIASMQGFFVHVSNGAYPVTGTFAVNNAARVNNLSPVFHKSTLSLPVVNPRIILRVSTVFDGDANSADPVAIYTDDNAAPVFNKTLDAIKLMNTNDLVPNFSLAGPNSTKLAIHALKYIDSSTVIPLNLQTNKNGLVNFNLLSAENLPANLTVYLYDAKTGVEKKLQPGSPYGINLAASNYQNRFSLRFSSSSATTKNNSDQDVFYLYKADGKLWVNLNLKLSQSGYLTVTNMLGNVLSRTKINGNGIYEVGNQFINGIYVVSFIAPGSIHAKKTFISY